MSTGPNQALAHVGPFVPDDDFVDENVGVDGETAVATQALVGDQFTSSGGPQQFLAPQANIAASYQSAALDGARTVQAPLMGSRASSSTSSAEDYTYSADPQRPLLDGRANGAFPTSSHSTPPSLASRYLSASVGAAPMPSHLYPSPLAASTVSTPGAKSVGVACASPPRHHFDCFSDMLENAFLSDISIRTRDGIVVPAHRVVLAAVSPTFRTILRASAEARDSNAASEAADAAEGVTDERDGVISVPYSYEEGGFRLVLQYMYTGAITGFESGMAVSLLEASSYFQLDELKSLAVKALCASTTEENVFERLDLALSYSCAGLREHSLMIIRQYNTEVIHSREWLALPLDVALLLVQETVIEGEMAILRRCYEWCVANASASRVEETLVKFLKFVDFTAMTEAEVGVVEAMQCVPLSILYDAFKRSVLGLPPAHVPRNGGIVLQWEMRADQHDVEVVNNHVTKISADYVPRTVCAINKFSRGRHYWTVNVMDLRLPHDGFVGVMYRPQSAVSPPSASSVAALGAGADNLSSPLSPSAASIFSDATEPLAFVFEPCCMALRAPDGCEVTKEEAASASILIERWCEVGVLLDFSDNSIRWFNHRTKQLLFTLRCPDKGPLPAPLYPCVTLIHRSNGGAMLSESTTYVAQRPATGRFAGPTSVTPLKSGARGGGSAPSSSAILAAGGSTPFSQRSSPHAAWAGSLQGGLASVAPAQPQSRPQGTAGGVFVGSGTL